MGRGVGGGGAEPGGGGVGVTTLHIDICKPALADVITSLRALQMEL